MVENGKEEWQGFYDDQSTKRKRRCVDEVVPLTQSDLRFRHDAQQPSIPMSTYVSASPSLEQCSAFASDSNNDADGSASQSSETSEESIFTPQDSHPSHAQNRRRWTNLARMYVLLTQHHKCPRGAQGPSLPFPLLTKTNQYSNLLYLKLQMSELKYRIKQRN